jgi:hypothetical protein
VLSNDNRLRCQHFQSILGHDQLLLDGDLSCIADGLQKTHEGGHPGETLVSTNNVLEKLRFLWGELRILFDG